MSETAAAPEAAETQPNPYEIVRVSGPNGHESLRRVLVEGLQHGRLTPVRRKMV